mmetsp:Transcript_139322/g.242225  ORF Transcript_139322/g.242225 Transcript_139322/m.242225 type:complete len:307 (-) Transcript_139322:204-1124(-)
MDVDVSAQLTNANTVMSTLMTRAETRALLDQTDVFIFDCDGVIWTGDRLIEGVPETLQMLRDSGKKIFFVTNASGKSRAGYKRKFAALGLPVQPEEIYPSSYAAASYLLSNGFPNNKKVYVIGEVGIEEELQTAGIAFLGGTVDAGKELKPGTALEHDRDVAAVVVGFDGAFNYHKIQYAQLCLNQNPGCQFIACNTDAIAPMGGGSLWAGAGAMVGSIKGCTGLEPTVVGKPSSFMMDDIAGKLRIDKSRICMVGDRLDTDILFGQSNGTRTLLVLTGVTTQCVLAASDIRPDFVASSVASLLDA